MTPSHKTLLNLFIANTGKTTTRPRGEPDQHQLVGYQQPRTDRFRFREKVDNA